MNKKRDPFAEQMRAWHVMTLLIHPCKYRAERMKNYPNSPLEQSPDFDTEEEALAWIEAVKAGEAK